MSQTAVITFNFSGQSLNCITDEAGNPLFRADDVCEILEFVNTRDALANHVDTEDVAKRDTLTAGGVQAVNHVNESGLYSLIFGSKKPAAKSFKRWVTSDVLPAIRKTGAYVAPATQPTVDFSAHTLELVERMNASLQLQFDTLQSEVNRAMTLLRETRGELTQLVETVVDQLYGQRYAKFDTPLDTLYRQMNIVQDGMSKRLDRLEDRFDGLHGRVFALKS